LKDIPHPKPWQSELWQHLALIRKRRLARASWPEIAAELQGLGVSVHPDTVGHFFRRAQKTKLPRGFSEGVEAKAAREMAIELVPSDIPLIGADGKGPLLEEIPEDSPWAPKGRLVGNSRV
jgi:hypothetical protein